MDAPTVQLPVPVYYERFSLFHSLIKNSDFQLALGAWKYAVSVHVLKKIIFHGYRYFETVYEWFFIGLIAFFLSHFFHSYFVDDSS